MAKLFRFAARRRSYTLGTSTLDWLALSLKRVLLHKKKCYRPLVGNTFLLPNEICMQSVMPLHA